MPAEGAWQRLAKLVAGAVPAAQEFDVGNDVVIGDRSPRPGRRTCAEISVGLRFYDAVLAWLIARETESAVAIGCGAQAGVFPQPRIFVEAIERKLHVGDAN